MCVGSWHKSKDYKTYHVYNEYKKIRKYSTNIVIISQCYKVLRYGSSIWYHDRNLKRQHIQNGSKTEAGL